MIRINLAAERARPKVKRRVAVGGAVFLIFVLIALVAGIGVLFVHGYMIDQRIESLRTEKASLEAQRAELAKVEKEIKDFEAKKALLEGRVKVIETLKANQTGPVRMLEAIGDTVSITDTLWLTNMTEKAGGQIEMKGVAGSVEAVAGFITNLNRSTYFKDVEIKETVQRQARGADAGAASNFDFTLSATFALPQATPAQPPAPAAPAPAPGRRG
ncbi:MAG: PilN domain-containing protein [Acidobacteria bacterium]|nr:PilN domain-containing protein [Acidobacteriota bacterium]